jgi:hypothetical protein
MPDYYCEVCDFFSNRISNYKRHTDSEIHKLKTSCINISREYEKHPKKIIKPKKFICKKCEKCFTEKTNWYRHMKHVCNVVTENYSENNNKVKDLENKLKSVEDENKRMKELKELENERKIKENEKRIKEFEEDKKKWEVERTKMVDIVAINSKTTMSAMKYAMTYMTNGPGLKLLEGK